MTALNVSENVQAPNKKSLFQLLYEKNAAPSSILNVKYSHSDCPQVSTILIVIGMDHDARTFTLFSMARGKVVYFSELSRQFESGKITSIGVVGKADLIIKEYVG